MATRQYRGGSDEERSAYQLRIPKSLYLAVSKVASDSGVSVNNWLANTIQSSLVDQFSSGSLGSDVTPQTLDLVAQAIDKLSQPTKKTK